MRSASFALMCCLNAIVTGSLETGAVQLALRERDLQRLGQRERAVRQVIRVRLQLSAASPAVEMTLALVGAV